MTDNTTATVTSSSSSSSVVAVDKNEESFLTKIPFGPSRPLTLQDVALVAYSKAIITLEENALIKMTECIEELAKKKKNTNKNNTTKVEDITVGGIEEELNDLTIDINTDVHDALSAEEARAVLIVRLYTLLQGKSGIPTDVVIFLMNILNAGIVPILPKDMKKVGHVLLRLLHGRGKCIFQGAENDFAKVLEESHLEIPSSLSSSLMTNIQMDSFKNGTYAWTGVAAILCYNAQAFGKIADGIAALSCEAYCAFTDPYDAQHFEIARPHRGQITSATNLRLLLEGSLRTNSRTCEVHDPSAIRCIPQYHGPAKETVAICAKMINIELNSYEVGPTSNMRSTSIGPLHVQQMDVVLGNLTNAFSALLNASRDRILAMNQGMDLYESNDIDDCLENTFAIELSISMSILQEEADKMAKQAEEDLKRKEEARAKNATQQGNKPETDDLAGMDPAKRAKIEAKRKAKAEKEAAKAAAKAAKKKQGLTLGAGSTELRNFIMSATGGDTSRTSILDILSPQFAKSEHGLFTLSDTILEKLSSGGAKRKPKIAKGTRDYLPAQMAVREKAFNIIRTVFKRHGAVEIDTPVFELNEVLTGKYGEEGGGLIYDLADQGGELLSLRYDLTVPFARFLAMNPIGNIKRFHIAKVYRRDNPVMSKGRYREFYQCDFDIAGTYPTMVPDAEVLTVGTEILSALPIGDFMIKLNHRKLLDSIFAICGVPADKFRTICSAVDKLDKEPWEAVKREMVDEKGLSEASADQIGKFVLLNGAPMELLADIKEKGIFGSHPDAVKALADLELLFNYLDASGALKYISFDMSLARGLDYYTGVIYEAVMTSGKSQVGSIAAGGRYDYLVGIFSNTENPCVGISIGVERVFTIMEQLEAEDDTKKESSLQVFVASIGEGLVARRMAVARKLYNANIPTEYSYQENPKFKKQLDDVLNRGIPYMVVFGQEEIDNDQVKIKDMENHTEETVSIEGMVEYLTSKGCKQIRGGVGLE